MRCAIGIEEETADREEERDVEKIIISKRKNKIGKPCTMYFG